MVDPVTIAVLLGLTILGAAALWHKILAWAQETLFPWMERNYPSLASFVCQAFAVVDDVVAPLRAAAKRAWIRIREVLVDMLVEFSRLSGSDWVRRVVAWVIKELPTGEKKPAKVVVEEQIEWDELPPEVRAGFLRYRQSQASENVIRRREGELSVAH